MPGRTRLDPGVPEGVLVDVETTEDHQLVGRGVVGGGVVAAGRGSHRRPGGPVEGPGIAERVRIGVETPEQDQLAESGVVGERRVRARTGGDRRRELCPGRAGVDPGVTQRGLAVRGEPAEEDQLAARLVVGHRGEAPGRWRVGRDLLDPVGPVVGPGVGERSGAVRGQPAEEDLLSEGWVVRHRVIAPCRRGGRRPRWRRSRARRPRECSRSRRSPPKRTSSLVDVS